jgi:hypothetical protein
MVGPPRSDQAEDAVALLAEIKTRRGLSTSWPRYPLSTLDLPGEPLGAFDDWRSVCPIEYAFVPLRLDDIRLSSSVGLENHLQSTSSKDAVKAGLKRTEQKHRASPTGSGCGQGRQDDHGAEPRHKQQLWTDRSATVVAISDQRGRWPQSEFQEAPQHEPGIGVRETVGHRQPVSITLIGGAQKTGGRRTGLACPYCSFGAKMKKGPSSLPTDCKSLTETC